jgi:hypothetical protein
MSIASGRGRLATAMKDLMGHWIETRAQWNDPVSRQFEKKFLLPLETDVRQAIGAMEEAGQICQHIRRDCE